MISVLLEAGAYGEELLVNVRVFVPVDTVARTLVSLVKGGVNVDVGNDNGCSPLHLAAHCGFTAVLTTLIRCGASLDIKGSFDGVVGTPLSVARNSATAEPIVEAELAAGW